MPLEGTRGSSPALRVHYWNAELDFSTALEAHRIDGGGIFVTRPSSPAPGTLLRFELLGGTSTEPPAGAVRVKASAAVADPSTPTGMALRFVHVADALGVHALLEKLRPAEGPGSRPSSGAPASAPIPRYLTFVSLASEPANDTDGLDDAFFSQAPTEEIRALTLDENLGPAAAADLRARGPAYLARRAKLRAVVSAVMIGASLFGAFSIWTAASAPAPALRAETIRRVPRYASTSPQEASSAIDPARAKSAQSPQPAPSIQTPAVRSPIRATAARASQLAGPAARADRVDPTDPRARPAAAEPAEPGDPYE